ncbi:MAG: hypothetical protein H0U44_09000 [Flavisolibacter sp.]|jgi:hypothetical protein|nr:hypothetical protein [Flavisolibacter sp.]
MKFLFPAIIFVLGFAACKKSDPDPVVTNTDLITSGSWKFETGGIDTDGNGSIDLTMGAGLLAPCIADNFADFSANGTGVANEGATKCDPAAPQTEPFTWAFTNNETRLNITGLNLFGLGNNFKITTLTETRLGLSKDTTLPGFPAAISLVVHLKH